MDVHVDNKLKNLLQHWSQGSVATTPWLKSMSISDQLTQIYLKANWIEALGYGAYKKVQDKVTWYSAISSIQEQLNHDVHVGGLTSFELNGASHYIRNKSTVYLFSMPGQKLPKWFIDYDWGNPIELVKTSFLPDDLGIAKFEHKGFSLNISSKERAILECLYLAPDKFDILECYQLIEGLNSLRPALLQDLLVECRSIQTKRLFLYMAKKAKLPVFKALKLDSINLGSGDRTFVRHSGVYISEFKINISKELAEYV